MVRLDKFVGEVRGLPEISRNTDFISVWAPGSGKSRSANLGLLGISYYELRQANTRFSGRAQFLLDNTAVYVFMATRSGGGDGYYLCKYAVWIE